MKNKPSKLGYFYVLLSSLFFGTYGVWSKLMSGTFGEFFQAWTRALIILLCIIPLGIFTKQFKKIKREDVKWFLIISIPGSLVFPLYFYGFKNLGIGIGTLVFFGSYVIGSYILGIFFFKEKLTFLKIGSLILAILGLSLISYTGSSNELSFTVYAFIACALAGFCGSVEVVFTSKVSSKYSPTQITSVLYFSILVLNLLFSFFYKDIRFDQGASAWLAQLGYSLSALLAFVFAVMGYRTTKPSIASIIGLLEIVFASLFGIIIYAEKTTFLFLLGGLFLLMSSLFSKRDDV